MTDYLRPFVDEMIAIQKENARLHEVNSELVEALEKIEAIVSPYRDGVKFNYIADIAQAALAKAQGDNNANG